MYEECQRRINFDLGLCGPSVELGANKLRTRVRRVLAMS